MPYTIRRRKRKSGLIVPMRVNSAKPLIRRRQREPGGRVIAFHSDRRPASTHSEFSSWHRVPIWKGYLKLSLVSCAVAMYTATSTSSRIRLHIINRETGNRIRNQAIDSETGDVVENEDKVKGYEVDKGKYVLLEEDELDEVALEIDPHDRHRAFVPRDEVDEIYLDESFYIVPNDEVAYEAFAVIREAMKKKDMVGLGRVVMHRRERLLMLEPRGKGIAATALRYKPTRCATRTTTSTTFRTSKVPADMLQLAEHILEPEEGPFRPGQVRGPLRGRAERADQGEARRQGAAGSADAEAEQRHQPDGCAAPQREGRKGGAAAAATAKSSGRRTSAQEERPPSTSA